MCIEKVPGGGAYQKRKLMINSKFVRSILWSKRSTSAISKVESWHAVRNDANLQIVKKLYDELR